MKQTGTILDQIIVSKKQYLERRKAQIPLARLEQDLAGTPPSNNLGFYEVLKAPEPNPKIIAEVKKASPSAGVLRDPFVPAEINEAYQTAANVVAISVITERDYFQGSENTLEFFAANNTNNKPLLRKDFIFDSYQILESKVLGAQAYLLIASLFDIDELQALVDHGRSIGIEPLIEVHTVSELKLATATQARCIGVNSRDLKTFKVDIKKHEMLRQLDDSYARVAESGVESAEYLAQVSTYTDAVLIGSHFMSYEHIRKAIDEAVTLSSASPMQEK